MEESVKVSMTFTDGRRFSTEVNAQVWLKKIKMSKVSTGSGDIYRMNFYPVEMLVPLSVGAEAIEDLLFMLPQEKVVEILRAVEDRMRGGW